MKLIFYRKKDFKTGKIFEKIISSTVKDVSFKVFHDINLMQEKCTFTIPGQKDFFILLIDTFQELKEIVSLKNFFKDKRVLLVLSNNHKLSPVEDQDTWYSDLKSSDGRFIHALNTINTDIRHFTNRKVA